MQKVLIKYAVSFLILKTVFYSELVFFGCLKSNPILIQHFKLVSSTTLRVVGASSIEAVNRELLGDILEVFSHLNCQLSSRRENQHLH